MASEEQLWKKYVDLNSQIKKGNYQKAIEICNAIRSKFPHEEEAVRAKCVCLIHLGETEKALAIAKKYDYLLYEQCYCHYRLKQLDEALQCLEKAAEERGDEDRFLHLEGQIRYRMEDFDHCVEIYRQLIKRAEGDTLELQTNLLAAFASAGRGKEGIELVDVQDGEENHELIYNIATAFALSGYYQEARKELERAEECCRRTLKDEGAPESEIEDEAAVIRAQLAYVAMEEGETKEALTLCKSLLHTKTTNAAVTATVVNNAVILRGERDAADSYKRMKAVITSSVEKLPRRQQEIIMTNWCLLLCQLGKGEECREAMKQLKLKFPESTSSSLIQTALLLKEKKYSECENLLKENNDDKTQLALAHLYLLQGKKKESLSILKEIKSNLRHSPGLLCTIVSLSESIGDQRGAVQLMEEAIQKRRSIAAELDKQQQHQSEKGTQGGQIDSERGLEAWNQGTLKIQEAAAQYYLQHQIYDKAAELLKEIIEGGASIDAQTRLKALANLTIARSYVDPAMAEEESVRLPLLYPPAKDISELENSCCQLTKRAKSQKAVEVESGAMGKGTKRRAETKEKVLRKRAKRREKYLEKLSQRERLNVKDLPRPDPERWIPRKQRSYARRGRKARGRFVGAQGAGIGTEKDAHKFDAAARAAQKDGGEKKQEAHVASAESAMQRRARRKRR